MYCIRVFTVFFLSLHLNSLFSRLRARSFVFASCRRICSLPLPHPRVQLCNVRLVRCNAFLLCARPVSSALSHTSRTRQSAVESFAPSPLPSSSPLLSSPLFSRDALTGSLPPPRRQLLYFSINRSLLNLWRLHSRSTVRTPTYC